MEMVNQLQLSTGVKSDAKMAVKMGINAATLSRAKHKEQWNMLGEGIWLQLAQYTRFSRDKATEWKHADTKVSRYLNTQFGMCQAMSMTAMLADDPGIGKTHCMREYARAHANVMCIDCSVSNTKGSFIRAVAREAGSTAKGRLQDILDAAIYAIGLMEKPLLILDESGDLEPSALLQLKKLYNALEQRCGFYMMGSDGFKSKILRGVEFNKLGFTEIFSRFDRDFKHAMSDNSNEKIAEYKEMAEAICLANGVDNKEDMKRIITDSFCGKRGMGDLRRVRKEVIKLRMIHEQNG